MTQPTNLCKRITSTGRIIPQTKENPHHHNYTLTLLQAKRSRSARSLAPPSSVPRPRRSCPMAVGKLPRGRRGSLTGSPPRLMSVRCCNVDAKAVRFHFVLPRPSKHNLSPCCRQRQKGPPPYRGTKSAAVGFNPWLLAMKGSVPAMPQSRVAGDPAFAGPAIGRLAGLPGGCGCAGFVA